MTFSLLARTHDGRLGAASASCSLAVGASVLHLRPGVGVCATQALTRAQIGPLALDALTRSIPAKTALTGALEGDPRRASRQVGLLGAVGPAATFTGERVLAEQAERAEADHAIVVNHCEAGVVEAMLPKLAEILATSSASEMARALLAALVAGQAAGGDARGQMSAAVLVDDATWPVDLRVDAHERPLDELARLLDVSNHLRRTSA